MKKTYQQRSRLKNGLRTSSSSAFRCLKRSLWLVTMGRIEVSADDVNGTGVVRVSESWKDEDGVFGPTILFLTLTTFLPRSKPLRMSCFESPEGRPLFSLLMDNKSVSSFSFNSFCFSSVKVADSSCSRQLCKEPSSSLWRI